VSDVITHDVEPPGSPNLSTDKAVAGKVRLRQISCPANALGSLKSCFTQKILEARKCHVRSGSTPITGKSCFEIQSLWSNFTSNALESGVRLVSLGANHVRGNSGNALDALTFGFTLEDFTSESILRFLRSGLALKAFSANLVSLC